MPERELEARHASHDHHAQGDHREAEDKIDAPKERRILSKLFGCGRIAFAALGHRPRRGGADPKSWTALTIRIAMKSAILVMTSFP